MISRRFADLLRGQHQRQLGGSDVCTLTARELSDDQLAAIAASALSDPRMRASKLGREALAKIGRNPHVSARDLPDELLAEIAALE
jgi:hypothetical protein